MNENMKEFLKKVSEDTDMQAKMKSFTNGDEAYDWAKSVQDGFTKEEFTEVMTKFSEAANGDGELSDEDLASVAGGVSNTGVTTVDTLMNLAAGI